MLKWRYIAMGRFGTLALAAYIAWLAWENLGPHKPEADPVRRDFADKIILIIVDDLRNFKADINQAALLHFENDPTDYFTNRLRLVVEQSGIIDLRDRTFGEKLANVTNRRHKTYGSLYPALSRGKMLDAEGIIFGRIHSFESWGGKAKIDVEICVVDVPNGQVVFSKRYSEESSSLSFAGANIEAVTKKFPWFKRLLGWFIAVLLLPVFSISFIRGMVRKNSNKANAFVLCIYTLVDALLAWLMVGAALNSWLSIAVFITAVIAAFIYNLRVMTFAVQLEEG